MMNMHRLLLAIGILIIAILILTAGWIGVPFALVFGLPWVWAGRSLGVGDSTGPCPPFQVSSMHSAPSAQEMANDQILNPIYNFLPQNVFHHQRDMFNHPRR